MKTKNMKIFIISSIFFILLATPVLAYNIGEQNVVEAQYTEEYKKWLMLSEEEKKEFIQPKKYKTKYDEDNLSDKISNPFKKMRMTKSSASSKYSLKNIIPNNVKIKNQEDTQSCWAFASIRSIRNKFSFKKL